MDHPRTGTARAARAIQVDDGSGRGPTDATRKAAFGASVDRVVAPLARGRPYGYFTVKCWNICDSCAAQYAL
jgi:hypothetical protein